TTFSPLAPVLAKRAKSSVIGLHCTTTGPDHWDIHITSVPELNTQACTDSLEAAWRSSPADVFWFQDRWRLRGDQPLAFLEKAKRLDLDRVTNFLKVLLVHDHGDSPSIRKLPHADTTIKWITLPSERYDPDNIPLVDLVMTWKSCTLPSSSGIRVYPFNDLF
ncbi:MAG: hypothetical protein QNK83_13185, partial [Akkermansiaceae bacterium]